MGLDRISSLLAALTDACRRNPGRVAVLLAAATVALAIESGGDTVRELLRYERAAIAAGDWWRPVTGHFVHLGWGHVALNLVGLTLVWLLFAPDFTLGQWGLIGAVAMVSMDAGFYFLEPQLEWYVGLSGLLHGLFAAGTVRWLAGGGPEAVAMAAFLIGKLIWEQIGGPLPLSEQFSGGPVVVDAHLYGALGGAAVAATVVLRESAQRRL